MHLLGFVAPFLLFGRGKGLVGFAFVGGEVGEGEFEEWAGCFGEVVGVFGFVFVVVPRGGVELANGMD